MATTDSTQTDETEQEDSPVQAASARTPADLTRLASDEELKDLKRLKTRNFRRRKTVLAFGILVAAALILALIVQIALGPENPVTWPGAIDGNYNDARQIVTLDPTTAFLVYWPNDPRTVRTGDGTNRLEVITPIGRKRDVPLHLLLTVNTLTNDALRLTTDRSYRAWRDAVSDHGLVLDFASEKRLFLNFKSSGFPVHSIDYVRTTAASPLYGRAFYFRHYEREIVFMREIPLRELWRCHNLLDSFPCLAANLTAVRNHLEIPATRAPGGTAEMFSEVYANISRNLESENWSQLELKIKTVLLDARERKDQKLEDNARNLWRDLRTREDIWYYRKCLEYRGLGELTPNDRQRNAAILAERNHLRRQALDRFSDPDDARHERIINDEWSISQ